MRFPHPDSGYTYTMRLLLILVAVVLSLIVLLGLAPAHAVQLLAGAVLAVSAAVLSP